MQVEISFYSFTIFQYISYSLKLQKRLIYLIQNMCFCYTQCWDFSVINREIGYFLEENLGYFASRLFSNFENNREITEKSHLFSLILLENLGYFLEENLGYFASRLFSCFNVCSLFKV